MSVCQPFPRVTPESVGIPSKAIEALLHNFYEQGVEMHSLMILRHGKVCAEGWWKPYGPDKLHNVHSFTKTFVATGIGLLVEDGLISLEDKVVSFFPEDVPENPGENLLSMNVHNLLSMSTGHHQEPMIRGEKEFVRAFLAWPVDHAPGTWFTYNSNATHMLGRIIHKVTGKTFPDFLRERLLDRMGFGTIECSVMADGFPSGGGGFALTTEDMARLGQLYMNYGRWNGEQLVPESWIRAATVPQSDNSNGQHRDGNEDWEAGYGYQLWQNDPWLSYRFDGAFGQEAVAYPAQDLLVICTAATSQMPLLLNLIHRFMKNQVVDQPLPENPAAWGHVQKLLANLSLDEVKPGGQSWLQEKADGLRIALHANEAVLFNMGFMYVSKSKPGVCALTPRFEEGALTLEVETPEKTYAVRAGMNGEAIRNLVPVDDQEMELWASAKWKDQNVLSVTWRTLRMVYTLRIDVAYGLERAQVKIDLMPRGQEQPAIIGEYVYG